MTSLGDKRPKRTGQIQNSDIDHFFEADPNGPRLHGTYGTKHERIMRLEKAEPPERKQEEEKTARNLAVEKQLFRKTLKHEESMDP